MSGLYIDYEKVMPVADPESSWLVTNCTNESQNSVDYRTNIRMYRTSWLRSEGCGTSCQEKCGDDCFVEDHGEVCGKELFEEVLAATVLERLLDVSVLRLLMDGRALATLSIGPTRSLNFLC